MAAAFWLLDRRAPSDGFLSSVRHPLRCRTPTGILALGQRFQTTRVAGRWSNSRPFWLAAGRGAWSRGRSWHPEDVQALRGRGARPWTRCRRSANWVETLERPRLEAAAVRYSSGMLQDLWYKNAIIYSLDLETFHGRERRRRRRLRGADPAARLPPAPGRRRGLARPLPADAQPRQRLRHLRLLRRRSAAWLERRLRRVHAPGEEARASACSSTSSSTTPRTSTPGSRRPAATRTRRTATGTSGRRNGRGLERGDGLPGRAEADVDLRRRRRKPTTTIASTSSSRTSTWTTRRCGRRSSGSSASGSQLGVSGFRVDAVPFIIERQGSRAGKRTAALRVPAPSSATSCSGAPATRSCSAKRTCCRTRSQSSSATSGDGIHMMFNFWVNQHLFYALATGDVAPARRSAARRRRSYPLTAQWANFLRNHDELDLGRLTKEQRQAVFARFGPEKTCSSTTAASAGGSRRCSGDRRARARLQPAVLAAGNARDPLRRRARMGDDLSLKERDAVRTPMQWSIEPNGGSRRPRSSVAPVIDEGPYGYEQHERRGAAAGPRLAAQLDARMIRLRQGVPGDRLGRLRARQRPARRTCSRCATTGAGSAVIVLHNFDERPHEVALDSAPGRRPARRPVRRRRLGAGRTPRGRTASR